MVVFAVLILCAQIIKVFSNENAGTCESPIASDGRTDGYSVLAEGRKFRLVFMTVNVNKDAYRCITTTTIAKKIVHTKLQSTWNSRHPVWKTASPITAPLNSKVKVEDITK
uniref:Putative secreted protein n=1 Tax=Amblyomma triste TaxID=251400 RepID=A0A023GC02_AMBTT